MEKEVKSLYDNKTWELIPRTPRMKTLSPKWVFNIKPKTKKKEQIFQARLVCKRYQQRSGINLNETYAPVVRMASLRRIFAVALQKDMHNFQMDM